MKANQHSRDTAAAIDYKLTVASGFLAHLKLACSHCPEKMMIYTGILCSTKKQKNTFRLECFNMDPLEFTLEIPANQLPLKVGRLIETSETMAASRQCFRRFLDVFLVLFTLMEIL